MKTTDCYQAWKRQSIIHSIIVAYILYRIFNSVTLAVSLTLLSWYFILRPWGLKQCTWEEEEETEMVQEEDKTLPQEETTSGKPKNLEIKQLLGALTAIKTGDTYFFIKYSEAGSMFKELTDFRKAEEAVRGTTDLYTRVMKTLEQNSPSHRYYEAIRISLESRIEFLSEIEGMISAGGNPRLVDYKVYSYRNYVKTDRYLMERMKKGLENEL